MGGGGTTIQQPAMPSYGEGLADALQVQLAMTTGKEVGKYDFGDVLPRGMESIVAAERPGRMAAIQLEADLLRRQMLGSPEREAVQIETAVSADGTPVRGWTGNLEQDAKYIEGLDYLTQEQKEAAILKYALQGPGSIDIQPPKLKEGQKVWRDPVTGNPAIEGQVFEASKGLIDTYGPQRTAQYATAEDVAAGVTNADGEAVKEGDFLGYRSIAKATEADVQAGRAEEVGEFMGLAPAMQQGMEYMAASQREADVRDVERLGQRATAAYRSQGTTVDSKGNVTGGIQGALDRISGLAGQTAPTTLQSYSGPTYTPPTEYSPVSVNEYADPLTAAAMDRRAAMIADRETAQNITLPEASEFLFEQRAPDLPEPQQRTVVAPAPVDVMERRYDYGQRVRPVKNLNNPDDKGQQVNAGPTTLQELSSQMGTSLDPIRSRLFSQAVSGLQTGLTAREKRNVEQASRLATGARGRLRDFGSTVKEVQDVMAEDRNRLNQNRAFAQSVLGGEQGFQQRALAAAESDLARADRRQAADRGFALQALGAEQATSADPFMSILGRPSGAAAGAAQGLLAAGQQNNAMAGPQFINPESGLSYISQMAANKANMFGAQQQANAARSAGTMGMLGSLGGGLLGGVFK